MTFWMHIRPRNREFMTMCSSVLAQPSPRITLWPDEDPSCCTYAILLARTSSLRQKLLQFVHHLFPCKACAPSTLWTSQQFLVPKKPWDSILLDFIEKLPPSSSDYTAILVIVDHMTKQGLFISTHNTITSQQLAQLFVLHIFSKHGIPSHVTSD